MDAWILGLKAFERFKKLKEPELAKTKIPKN